MMEDDTTSEEPYAVYCPCLRLLDIRPSLEKPDTRCGQSRYCVSSSQRKIKSGVKADVEKR